MYKSVVGDLLLVKNHKNLQLFNGISLKTERGLKLMRNPKKCRKKLNI